MKERYSIAGEKLYKLYSHADCNNTNEKLADTFPKLEKMKMLLDDEIQGSKLQKIYFYLWLPFLIMYFSPLSAFSYWRKFGGEIKRLFFKCAKSSKKKLFSKVSFSGEDGCLCQGALQQVSGSDVQTYISSKVVLNFTWGGNMMKTPPPRSNKEKKRKGGKRGSSTKKRTIKTSFYTLGKNTNTDRRRRGCGNNMIF